MSDKIIDSEKYLNQQINDGADPEWSKYGRIGYFINPPQIKPSDEVVDFDGIDLVSDEDDDFIDDDDIEDC